MWALLALVPGLALAAEPPKYVNTLSADAVAVMQKIVSRDSATLKTDAEKGEWASARLAYISLRRLQGQEDEALRIFAGCTEICAKYGPEKEWGALKEWGCQKKREANPCLPSNSTKTKAQKPPR